MRTIRCGVHVNELPKPLEPVSFERFIIKRLQENGIPIDDEGSLLSGALHHLYDPEDFGRSEYLWVEDKKDG